MKKKIVKVSIIAVIVLAAGWNFGQRVTEIVLTDVALANVEAIAACEKIAGSCWVDYVSGACCDAGQAGCAPCD